MKKGDTIRFLDAVGSGKVVQYDEFKQLVWVETDDGFDIGPLPASSCVVCIPSVSYQLSAITNRQPKVESPSPAVVPQTASRKRAKRQRDEHIIDLHIEALPTSGSGMTDVEKHSISCDIFA